MVERYSQIAFTICEATISCLYIRSLLEILRSKATVRQRRVMWDLIYVIVTCVSLDTLTIVLIWVNQTDIQHSVQNFSYMLKFRLEFVVLNQLMTVAARGIRRETMAEKRYHRTPVEDTSGGNQVIRPSTERSRKLTVASEDNRTTQSTKISMPQAAFFKGSLPIPWSSNHHHQESPREDLSSPGAAENGDEKAGDRSGDEKVDHAFDHMARNAVPGEGGADNLTASEVQKGPSTDTIQRSGSGTSDNIQLLNISTDASKPRRFGSLRTRLYQRNAEDENDEDENEIGLHMWENRGSAGLNVPWFKSKVDV